MSIKKIFNNQSSNNNYAGSLRRSSAAFIDVAIVFFFRVIVMQILGSLWINPKIVSFLQEFQETFGTQTPKDTREHIEFIIHHSIFISVIIFYLIVVLVGAIYHAYLNSSAWNGTIGKRLMKITIAKESDQQLLPITLVRGFAHYFLSILPFVFILYLISFQARNNLTFFQTITYSELNLFLGIIFVFWLQIHLFVRKKTTAYDMICKTVLINNKTTAKWPWSK